MIRRLFCAALAVLVMLLGSSARAEDVFCDALVRLHVIAEDDSPEAQRLKLHVRDAVVRFAQAALADCGSAEEAWQRLPEYLDDFEAVARTAAGQDVVAETGVFSFPARTYAGTTVPAGRYRALRIVIGSGEGRNWWCVLYPSLCLPSEGGYYSLFGRWLDQLFGGESA